MRLVAIDFEVMNNNILVINIKSGFEIINKGEPTIGIFNSFKGSTSAITIKILSRFNLMSL